MLAIPYLLLSFLAALVIVQRVFREFPVVVRLVGAFVVSITLTGWVNFGAGWLLHSLGRSDATFYGAFVAMGTNAVIIGLGWREFRRDAFRIPPLAILGVGAALALSTWVMLQRLSGDPLMVSLNTWGDTALHIGIARSFSQGDNFPPVFPIFSGETIRYHFGFDFYAGALERMGLPIEWAFNLPGALGFTAIMVLVFEFAYYLWRRVSIGIIAAILIATNGSLAFLRYFAKYPSVAEALKPQNWWNLDKYLAIAPYQNGERISIFWDAEPVPHPDPSHRVDRPGPVRRLCPPVASARTRRYRRGRPGRVCGREPAPAPAQTARGRPRCALRSSLLAQRDRVRGVDGLSACSGTSTAVTSAGRHCLALYWSSRQSRCSS